MITRSLLAALARRVRGSAGYKALLRGLLAVSSPLYRRYFLAQAGSLRLDDELCTIAALKKDAFPMLTHFMASEISKAEAAYLAPLTEKDFSDHKNLYFGVFHNHGLFAALWIRRTGFKSIEYGLAVSKQYRGRGIAAGIMKTVEEFCGRAGIKYFMRVSEHNTVMLELLQRRKYKIFAHEDIWCFLKKQL